VTRGEHEIGAGDTEQRTEEGEPAGCGGGDLLVRGRLDSTSQPDGICLQPWRRRPSSVMNTKTSARLEGSWKADSANSG
jgi:hypothetical protein